MAFKQIPTRVKKKTHNIFNNQIFGRFKYFNIYLINPCMKGVYMELKAFQNSHESI